MAALHVLSSCLAVLTADSAAPFARWLPGLDKVCSNSHSSVNFLNVSAVNCVPLSVVSSSGMPCHANIFLSFLITVSELMSGRWSISKNDEWLSVVIRYCRLSNIMISDPTLCHGRSGTSRDMIGSGACFVGIDAHTPHVSTYSLTSVDMPGQ